MKKTLLFIILLLISLFSFSQTNIINITKFVRTAKISGSYVIQVNQNGIGNWVTIGAGSSTFSSLTDGPGAYTGHAGEFIKVNTGESALQYAIGQLMSTVDKQRLDSMYLGQIQDSVAFHVVSGPTTHDSIYILVYHYPDYASVDSGFSYLIPKAGLVAANNLADVTNVATARGNLGVAIGVDVQAYNANLTTWAGKTAPSGTVIGTTDVQSISNKRWVPRVGSTTSSTTPTINTDSYDIYKLTAQTADITSMTTNLSGTPNDGDILVIQITGTATRTITWGSSFVSTSVTLPTTTVGTTTLTIVLIYSTTSSYGANKWQCVNTY